MKSAPNTVPSSQTENTPRYSGDRMPNFSMA